MKIKDQFIKLLEEQQLNPECSLGRKPKIRVKKVVERSAWISLGAGLLIAAQTTWSLAYDKHTRSIVEANYRVEEVYSRDGKSELDSIPVLAYTILTATGSQSWSVPADYNPADNLVECIGCGAHGTDGNQKTGAANGVPGNSGRGGGGGAYARKSNVPLTPGGTASYFIATANSGNDTWLSSVETVLADGASGQTGGQAGSSVGDVRRSGGNGGAANTTTGIGRRGHGGGGGGGAAGYSANGSNGSQGADGVSGAGNTGGDGGNGGAGSGPSGGAAGTSGGAGASSANGSHGGNGGNGGNGTYYDGTHGTGGGGKGGGGGGNGTTFPTSNGNAGNGGNGGLYGGGGGGGGSNGGVGSAGGAIGALGVGRQGLIAISWTPSTLRKTKVQLVA